ncbi:MAG: hypothetical protein K8J31_02895 [Anaerolineae bacterium]|nr:hypothetical protein [Anaerolineae bacterium]
MIVVIGGVLAIILPTRLPDAAPSTAARPYTIGNVRYCIGIQPPFLKDLGFSQRIALDTRAKYVKGAMVREFDQAGNVSRSYQDPSWTSAGYLGAYTSDQVGNIYLAPMPFISILDNPPDKANIIYQIDSLTGMMAPLIDLPAGAPLPPEAVYGLMDLVYDCDTNSLYAASVLGSTYDQVAGRIFQIDLTTHQVVATLDGVDAFSLDVFNSANGKQLYIGSARVPEIYSIPLDEKGHFSGDIRPVLSLEDKGFHRDERARGLMFQGQDRLIVTMLQFDFNLVASTETLTTVYEYGYNAQDDSWNVLNSYVTNE